jgi:hypothetical protein
VRPLATALAVAGVLVATSPATAIGAALHAGDPAQRRASIVVTNCDDDGAGSLREACANAIDGDQIDVGQLACSTITLASGALADDVSASNLTITGPVRESGRTLTISGDHADRIFVHNGDGTLSLYGLTIEAGRKAGGNGGCLYSHGGVSAQAMRFSDCAVAGADVHGGAIFALGDVSLEGSSISGSSASGTANASGGAIHSRGRVAITASTLTANTAIAASGSIRTGAGGGVYAALDATIGFSTLSGNHSAFGGGVRAHGLTLYDSTVSGNVGEGWGAGVLVATGPAVIANSTIAFNRNGAGAGAGVYLYGEARIDSTIIAGNTTGSPGTPTDVAGKAGAISGAHNLIRAADIAVPADTLALDPHLDPLLQDNGGWSPTHALLPGSPAVDHGSNPLELCCDQRFVRVGTIVLFERVVGAAADIGAFEIGAADRLFADGFDPLPVLAASRQAQRQSRLAVRPR